MFFLFFQWEVPARIVYLGILCRKLKMTRSQRPKKLARSCLNAQRQCRFPWPQILCDLTPLAPSDAFNQLSRNSESRATYQRQLHESEWPAGKWILVNLCKMGGLRRSKGFSYRRVAADCSIRDISTVPTLTVPTLNSGKRMQLDSGTP